MITSHWFCSLPCRKHGTSAVHVLASACGAHEWPKSSDHSSVRLRRRHTQVLLCSLFIAWTCPSQLRHSHLHKITILPGQLAKRVLCRRGFSWRLQRENAAALAEARERLPAGRNFKSIGTAFVNRQAYRLWSIKLTMSELLSFMFMTSWTGWCVEVSQSHQSDNTRYYETARWRTRVLQNFLVPWLSANNSTTSCLGSIICTIFNTRGYEA